MTTETPPFAKQTQDPPTLQQALELRDLLRDPTLQTPIVTHCELHSLMFNLHRAYRNLIADKTDPSDKLRKTLEANIIESLYQIDALPFLRRLKSTPERHHNRTFCTNCYQLGQEKTVISTNAPTANSTVLITRNISAFSEHSDPTEDHKPQSKKNPLLHPSLSESPTNEDTKTENPFPPLHPLPPHPPLAERSQRKEKERNVILHTNREK